MSAPAAQVSQCYLQQKHSVLDVRDQMRLTEPSRTSENTASADTIGWFQLFLKHQQ